MTMQKRYQCNTCGYEFKAYNMPKVCPYCGNKGTVKPLKTAEEILNEVSEE